MSSPTNRAADRSLPVEARARAAHDALLAAAGEPIPLDVDASVIEALSEAIGPSAALAVARAAAPPHRLEALARAVALRSEAGPGDEALSRALLELKRLAPLRQSLVDEYLAYAAERPRPSEMFLGAWGMHLLEVFAKIDDDDQFTAWVHAVHDANDPDSHLIRYAMRAAAIPERMEPIRDRLLWLFEQAEIQWVIDRPVGGDR